MASQESWIDQVWIDEYETMITELIMHTGIARQRVTIGYLTKELEKEKKRYERLKAPLIKKNSGVRVSMLRERLATNQNILRDLLIEKGYLSDASGIPF